MFKKNAYIFFSILACLVLCAGQMNAAPKVKHHSFGLNLTYGGNAKSETSFPWHGPFLAGENIGFSGKLVYNHFISENLALDASFGILYSRNIITSLSTDLCSVKQMMQDGLQRPPNIFGGRIYVLKEVIK